MEPKKSDPIHIENCQKIVENDNFSIKEKEEIASIFLNISNQEYDYTSKINEQNYEKDDKFYSSFKPIAFTKERTERKMVYDLDQECKKEIKIFKVFNSVEPTKVITEQNTIKSTKLQLDGINENDSKFIENDIKELSFENPYSPIESNYLITSPIISFPDTKLSNEITIKIYPDPSKFTSKNYKLSKITKREDGEEEIEIIKSTYNEELGYVEGIIDHFCIIAIVLDYKEVKEDWQKNNNLLQNPRVCSLVYDSSRMNNEKAVLKSFQDMGWRHLCDHFKNDLKWIEENVTKKPIKLGLACIRLYTGEGFTEINQVLRNRNKQWNEHVSKLKPYLNSFIWGLKSLPFYQGVVNRGISLKDSKHLFKKENFIIFQEIVSSTEEIDRYAKKTADKFSKGKTVIEILCKTGRSVKHISHYPKENEVIFLPGTVFKVIEEKRVKEGTDCFAFEEIVLPYGNKKCLWITDEINMGLVDVMNLQELNGYSVFWRSTAEEVFEMLENEQSVLSEPLKNFKIVTVFKEDKYGYNSKEKVMKSYEYEEENLKEMKVKEKINTKEQPKNKIMALEEKNRNIMRKEIVILKKLREMNYQETFAVFTEDVPSAMKNFEIAGVYNPKNVKIFGNPEELIKYLFDKRKLENIKMTDATIIKKYDKDSYVSKNKYDGAISKKYEGDPYAFEKYDRDSYDVVKDKKPVYDIYNDDHFEHGKKNF